MNKAILAAALSGALAWAAASGPAWAQPIYVEIDAAPHHIETYPHTYYEGRPVYFYDGHWYYRSGRHWSYYREEPPSLVEFRGGPPHHHHHRPPHPPGPGPRHHHHHER